jgi:GNAT superfamily N-acetyltransferase
MRASPPVSSPSPAIPMTPTAPPLSGGPSLERLLERVEIRMYEDLYRALPAGVAASHGIEGHRRGTALRLTARGHDHPFFNRTLGVVGPETLVGELAAHYAGAGIRRWMLQLLPHMETDDFRDAAEARGLVKLRGWAKHVAPASLRVPFRTDLTVRRIAGSARGGLGDVVRGDAQERALRAWSGIVAESFRMPEGFRPWLEALGSRPEWHLYLAYARDRPVAAAALHLPANARPGPDDPGPFAQLGWAGTRQAHRGRGAQSALIARRFEDARALGARWVAAETDEATPEHPNPSYRNLVRLGMPVRYVRQNWGPPKPE